MVYNKPNKINQFFMEKSINKTLKSDFFIDNIEEQLIRLKNFYDK